jgi:hypothetical protein
MGNTPNNARAGGVCNLNPIPLIPAPVAPTLPAIPIAQPNLQSLAQVVNALRLTVLSTLGQIPSNNSGNPSPTQPNPGPGTGSGSGGGSQNQNNKKSNFTEVKSARVYSTQDVPIVDTSGNNIGTASFKQIVGLTWNDPITGQIITWSQ